MRYICGIQRSGGTGARNGGTPASLAGENGPQRFCAPRRLSLVCRLSSRLSALGVTCNLLVSQRAPICYDYLAADLARSSGGGSPLGTGHPARATLCSPSGANGAAVMTPCGQQRRRARGAGAAIAPAGPALASTHLCPSRAHPKGIPPLHMPMTVSRANKQAYDSPAAVSVAAAPCSKRTRAHLSIGLPCPHPPCGTTTAAAGDIGPLRKQPQALPYPPSQQ